MCTEHELIIANTFFGHNLDETVTYYDIGTDPKAPASVSTFAQLDVALVWCKMSTPNEGRHCLRTTS